VLSNEHPYRDPGSKTDLTTRPRKVRPYPDSGDRSAPLAFPFGAKSRHRISVKMRSDVATLLSMPINVGSRVRKPPADPSSG
jgi:hypothetical protein